MNRLVTSTVGGFPLVLDDIRFFLGQSGQSEGIYQALNNLLRTFGDDFIIQGAIANFTTKTITEGWIMFDGELLKVDAHNIGTNTHFSKVITFDSAGDKKARNGVDIRAYQINRGVVNTTSGSLLADPTGINNRLKHKIIPTVRDELLSAATQINKGLIEIATQAEADTGTDDTRAITPKKLDVVQAGKIDIVSPVTTGNLVKLKSDGSIEESSTPASQVGANVTNIANLDINKLDKSLFSSSWASISFSALTAISNILSIDSGSILFLAIEKLRILNFNIELTLSGSYDFDDSIEFDLPTPAFNATHEHRSVGYWDTVVPGVDKFGTISFHVGETASNRIKMLDRGGIKNVGGTPTFKFLEGFDKVNIRGQLIMKVN